MHTSAHVIILTITHSYAIHCIRASQELTRGAAKKASIPLVNGTCPHTRCDSIHTQAHLHTGTGGGKTSSTSALLSDESANTGHGNTPLLGSELWRDKGYIRVVMPDMGATLLSRVCTEMSLEVQHTYIHTCVHIDFLPYLLTY